MGKQPYQSCPATYRKMIYIVAYIKGALEIQNCMSIRAREARKIRSDVQPSSNLLEGKMGMVILKGGNNICKMKGAWEHRELRKCSAI